MKILLVCPFFAPENAIAALRITKFAEYWAKEGHNVSVLARTPPSIGTSTRGLDNVKIIRVKDPWSRASMTGDTKPNRPLGHVDKVIVRVKKLIKRILFFPDPFALWAIIAQRKFKTMCEAPDVVVASGGPLSSLSLGRRLARYYDRPLVLDFRDLIATSPRYPYGRLRHRIERQIEKRAVHQASLVVSVSHGCAINIEKHYGCDVRIIENGFEPRDFVDLVYEPHGKALEIVYTGNVYPDRSSLVPFFKASRNVLERNPNSRIRLHFYGRSYAFDHIQAWAREARAEDLLVNHGMVSHPESLTAQVNADVLLLLLWHDDPRDHGVISGKFYEYIGAGRPIIQIGLEHGEAAVRLRSLDLGFASSDPSEIERYLESLLLQKEQTGRTEISALARPKENTREVQSLRFLGYITEMLGF